MPANPSFSGDQTGDLATYLDQRVAGPDEGGAILDRVANSAFRPHKRLLDYVARVIRNEPVLTLLDEQQVAYNAIMDSVRSAGQNQHKVAFIVAGGPGTSKSVLAVNLVAELAGSTGTALERRPQGVNEHLTHAGPGHRLSVSPGPGLPHRADEFPLGRSSNHHQPDSKER